MESQPRSKTPQKTKQIDKPATNKVVGPNVIRPPETFLARHGNTILTVVLLVAAAVLGVRWWNRSADNARYAVATQLESARESVSQLQTAQLWRVPPAELMGQVRQIQATVASAVSDVINKSEDPVVKARALVVRGDLDWAVANLPDLPGAATQPALRVEPPADDLLRQAADAYAAALNTAGADKESLDAARLGLAAIAENRGDWAGAKGYLQAVADETNGVAALSAAARAQLAELPTLQQRSYVAPPTGLVVTPTSAPATQPFSIPLDVPMPATMPAVPGMPATRPTTLPATRASVGTPRPPG